MLLEEAVPLASRAARGLDRTASTPLWKQLLDDLNRRLASGEFEAGFPGELELRDAYGISRHTVREALRHLREAGTVSAARGRPSSLGGTATIQQPIGALYSLFASVEAAGLVQRSVVRALDVRADAHVAGRLGLEASTPLLYLERLRLADDVALALDRVWLPGQLARPLLDVDFSHTSLYNELRQRCGVSLTGGQELLRAVVPSPLERRLLATGPEVGAFAIERFGLAGREPVEWRTTLIRGDRFSVLARFSPRGYELDLGENTEGYSFTPPPS